MYRIYMYVIEERTMKKLYIICFYFFFISRIKAYKDINFKINISFGSICKVVSLHQ